MDIKIIKKIGEGFNGTIYLIKSKNQKLVYKIEKLDDFDQGYKSIYHRQIDFDEHVARHHPERFMMLKSYGVIEDCAHKQPMPQGLEATKKKAFIKKNNLTKCLYLIY
jgi:hypothetical protein